MQSTTHLAPAVSVLFAWPFVTLYAGVASPLALLIAFAIVVMLGLSLAELSRAIVSAGGYYAYVGQAVHRHAGWLTGWLYVLYSPMLPGVVLAFLGVVLHSGFASAYGISIPWWLFVIGGAAITVGVAHRGIKPSVRLLVVLGVAELAIVSALGVSGLLEPGRGGFSFAAFDPSRAPSATGLYLAAVFSVSTYSGWEAAAPLAEESRDPRRIVPRAVLGSIVLMGVFLTLVTWGLVVGWGTANVQQPFASRGFAPFELAQRMWGGAWIVVALALTISALGVALACNNVATRMWFAMAREGALPRSLGHVDPRRRTPLRAVYLQVGLTLVVGLGLGSWLGPTRSFLMLGFAFSLSTFLIYGLGNAAVVLLYTRERRHELRPLLHVLVPVLSSGALAWVMYKSLRPLPPGPARYAPFVLVAWLAAGIAILIVKEGPIGRTLRRRLALKES